MATEFKLPELGENIAAGDVVRVLVSAGDSIAKDQPVLELETDKATIEVPSSVAGTVSDVKVKQGERVKVGQVVLTLDDGGGKANGASAEGKSKKADGKPARAAKEPEKAETAAPATKSGGADKPQAQPEGAAEEGGLSQDLDEAQPESDDAGRARAAAERDSGTTEEPEEQPAPPRKRGEVVEISRGARGTAPTPAPAEPAPGGPPPAAPSVRRLARELGVEIRAVTGTGPEGRISLDDVQAYVREAMSRGGGAAPSGTAAVTPLPDFTKWGEVERKPMSNIRRKTAEHLSNAWRTIPHVTQHDKADITGLEALRKQFGRQVEKAGGKLTVTAVALKVVAAAMTRFPQFNAAVDQGSNEIVYKKSVHVGVAVDTDRGLLVPVIRDVDRKGISELAADLAKMSEKARSGKLGLDEMSGGGFTITNLGGIGGTAFTPIVNWPEVAILGMSRGGFEPVWNGQAFEPRMMLPLSLSYDHRLIDGADGARFLRWVAEAFEQPFAMSL